MKETCFDLSTNSYKRDSNEVIQQLSSTVKNSKILFYLSVIFTILTFGLIMCNIINGFIGLILTIYFLVMIVILFPKISMFNKDALDVRNDTLEEIENKVLAVFPVDDENKINEWMIFVQTSDTEYLELEVPYAVGVALQEGDTVYVKYTKNTKTVIHLIKK